MSQVTIRVIRNGPCRIDGEIELRNDAGDPIATRPGKATFLCRCGGSANKPFCDGTHKRNGFEAD